MSLADWVRAKKKQRLAKKQAKMERKLALVEEEYRALDAETPEETVPQSRFTEEYKEFLKKQEAEKEEGPITREEV